MRFIKWIKKRLSHKLEHIKWSNVKKMFKDHGLALVVIIVGWEIVEDVVFPIIFAILGKYVHPAFFAGIPAAWIICLHWFMVPFIWGIWIKIKKEDSTKKTVNDCGSCDETR